MKIILLGSPGVGKGTYASMIKDRYRLTHISMGDLFREAVAKETKLGKKAREYIDKGNLVPDNITIEVLKKRLAKKDAKNFLLDGFPRTIAQAKALEKITKIDIVINFHASEKVILQRLCGRRICKKCGAIFHIINKIPKEAGICDKCQGQLYQRSDEMPEIIKKRLENYYKKTKPIEDFYRKKNLLREIKADIDMNSPNFKTEILDKIESILNEVKDK